jgi:hypothetical protein
MTHTMQMRNDDILRITSSGDLDNRFVEIFLNDSSPF